MPTRISAEGLNRNGNYSSYHERPENTALSNIGPTGSLRSRAQRPAAKLSEENVAGSFRQHDNTGTTAVGSDHKYE